MKKTFTAAAAALTISVAGVGLVACNGDDSNSSSTTMMTTDKMTTDKMTSDTMAPMSSEMMSH